MITVEVLVVGDLLVAFEAVQVQLRLGGDLGREQGFVEISELLCPLNDEDFGLVANLSGGIVLELFVSVDLARVDITKRLVSIS